jgi:hypothetical protein
VCWLREVLPVRCAVTLKRAPMPRPTAPMRQMSERRLQAFLDAGRYPTTTFSSKRPEPAVPPARRIELADRSGDWCEAGLNGCWRRATDPHHRILRGDGGVHGEAKEASDKLSDLLHLCRWCHCWAHAHRDDANHLGLILKRHQIPSQSFVVYRGEVMYLDDEGRVHDFAEVGA